MKLKERVRNFLILDYPKERMELFCRQSRGAVIQAWIGTLIFILSYSEHRPEWIGAVLSLNLALLFRLILIEWFRKTKVEKSPQWCMRFENILVINGLTLGFSYAYFTTTLAKFFFLPLIFSIFGIIFFGSLRSTHSSVKASIAVITMTLAAFTYFYAPHFIHGDLGHLIFLTLFLISNFFYLVKSQYLFAKFFLEKLTLEKNQEAHIKQLKDKLQLEEELKKQKAISIKNAHLASLGQMASGIAHEINNPLTIVQLNAKNLMKKFKKLGGEELEYSCNQIIKATDRASKIISSLRIFARDEKLSDIETYTIGELIEDVITFTEQRFKLNNIDLQIEWETHPDLKVKVNQVAWSQVLINLLNNAFFEMKKQNRSAERWCKIVISTVDNNMVQVEVIDAGKGIPKEIQKNMFTPFYTSKKIGEGTGLGLSIAKSMMQEMGGDLFYNAETPNTTFVIEIQQAD